jgi:beta-glucanase (GH16 family)
MLRHHHHHHHHRLTTVVVSVAVAALCASMLASCKGDARADSPAPPPGSAAPPNPLGQKSGWTPAFSDEFNESTLDLTRWADHSTAESDGGHGNLGNQQLEWNQAANCPVQGGALVMTAKREPVTSPSGAQYGWTSCLITTARSYQFQYGYLEERAILPAARGFWPAFWTWQARGVDQHTETDVYEFYSDNHQRLYVTQYSQAGGRCDWQPPFDPTADWHTYGVAIQESGTTWFVDGKQICHSDATADAPTSIISNLAVYSKLPPDDTTTTATKRVDYIRAWKPA